ncbi:MAG: hypothetical protein DMG12_19500 [Acidobacteria bacterium]|nr:MAG: hypothetical protein DMG12_19500 [Acidobacteriota bacterium]
MWATKRFLVLLIFFSISSCAIRSSSLRAQYDKRLERLEREKDKLKRATDPVDRTKTEIRIAEILLTFVSDAANAGDQERLEQRLDEYRAAIQDAHQTMFRTGRDAHKKPKGFKDLEIALRRQVRQLEDIGQGLSFDQREPVQKAKEEASAIRDQLLKALFGEQNAPSRKG